MAAKVRALQHQLDELEKEQAHRALVDCKAKRGRPSALSEKTDQELEHDLRSSKEKLALLESQHPIILMI